MEEGSEFVLQTIKIRLKSLQRIYRDLNSLRFCPLCDFVTGSVEYTLTLLTERVFVTQLPNNASHLSFINCVGYVRLLFHELSVSYIYRAFHNVLGDYKYL